MIRAFFCAKILSAALAKQDAPVTNQPEAVETPLAMKVTLPGGKTFNVGDNITTGTLNEELSKSLENPEVTKAFQEAFKPKQALADAVNPTMKTLADQIKKAADNVQTAPAVRTVADRKSDLEKNPTWMQQFGMGGAQCGLYMVQAIGYLLGAASKDALPKKNSFVDYAKNLYKDFYAMQLPADHANCVAILNAQGITRANDDFGLIEKSWWGQGVVFKGIQSMGLESNGHGIIPHAMKTYWPAKCDSKVVAWAVLSGSQERGHWTGLVRASNDADTKWIKVCSISGVSVLDQDQAKRSLQSATSIFPLTLNGAKAPVYGTPTSKPTSPVAPKSGVSSAVSNPEATQPVGEPQPQKPVSQPSVQPPKMPGSELVNSKPESPAAAK